MQTDEGVPFTCGALGADALEVGLPLEVARLLALPFDLRQAVLSSKAAHDLGEVGHTIGDVGSMRLAGKGLLGPCDYGQREASERSDKSSLGSARKAVGLVNPLQAQASAVILNPRALSGLLGNSLERAAIEHRALGIGALIGAGTALVGAQKCGENERGERLASSGRLSGGISAAMRLDRSSSGPA